jgi:hypothetical protein
VTRWSLAALAAAAATGACAMPADALASSAPELGIVAAEDGETAATLHAHVRPDGLRTRYEFWLEGPVCLHAPCAPVTSLVGAGNVEAGSTEEEVTATATGLAPDKSYTWWVLAGNAEGTTESTHLTFTTLFTTLPIPVNGANPFESKIEPWVAEAAAEWGRRQVEAAELERRAKERAAREASEREGREEVERESSASSSHAARCTVPSIHGDSLAAARRALRGAHCRLGRVSAPRKHRGHLVVRAQRPRPGRKLAAGSTVAVTLGPRA